MRKFLIVLVVLSACGSPRVETKDGAGGLIQRSAIDRAFEAAGDEFAVPSSILRGIGFVESRFSQRDGQPSADHGYGIMHLGDFGGAPYLARAEALTGLSRSALERYAAANIRGGAAVLRELADKTFASTPNLNPAVLADWFPVVMRYPPTDDARLAEQYAFDVFAAMARGESRQLDDGLVLLPATPSDFERHLLFLNKQSSALTPDYASATWARSPNYSAGRTGYKWVLIHTTQGSYAGTVSWFKNTSSQVSAHYVVKSSDGQITQMVEHANTAWHAQCYNSQSVGIEHEGFVNDPAWYTDAMYNASAKLTRWIADKHGIPRDRSHVIGHYEVASNCNTGGHTDPGPNWNWSKYMALVNGTTPGPTTGELKGAVYVDPDLNNRIAGASVTLTGNGVSKTMTVGSDGLYSFTVAPGTYTATASHSGYASNAVTKAITSGTTTWGSVGLKTAAAAPGVYRGKVYLLNDADPTNLSASVDGALVTLSDGQKITTAADGAFLFNAAPGAYTATATKAGLQSGSSSKTVVSGATVWGSIGVRPTATADKTPPTLTIDSPTDMASFELARVGVKGSATDNSGPLTKVVATVNGAAPVDVPVTMGRFDFEAKLVPGQNKVTVKGTDAAGNSDTASVIVFFRSGVSGFAFEGSDESKRVAGVTVSLWSGGTKADQATTDQTGSFSLDATPGDYVLKASLAGFATYQETVTVGGDDRATVKLPLQPGADGSPEVTISSPENGATLTASPAIVTGSVVGFAAVKIEVNGIAAELGAEGAFTATVDLGPGTNLLTAIATGASGETAQAVVEVKYAPETGSPGPVGQLPGSKSVAPASGACGCSSTSSPLLLGAALLPLILGRRRRSA